MNILAPRIAHAHDMYKHDNMCIEALVISSTTIHSTRARRFGFRGSGWRKRLLNNICLSLY